MWRIIDGFDYPGDFRGLYFITDHELSENGNIEDVKLALECGVRVIQYREKVRGRGEMMRELLRIKDLCKEYRALLILNDDLELALEVGVGGIHIGRGDGDLGRVRGYMEYPKVMGFSTSDLKEARRVKDLGADYIGVGAIFESRTKKKAGIGVGILRDFKREIRVPVVGIGGIRASNLEEVLETGIEMVASIEGLLGAGDLEGEIRKYQKLIARYFG